MNYDPSSQEIASVSAMPAEGRYRYMLSKIADWEEVWSVGSADGWTLMSNETTNELVPVWPSRKFASACCCDEWQDCEPRLITLDDWFEKWLPGMKRDGRSVAAFPLPDNKGTIVSPSRFEKDLWQELQQYR